jgi:hypothetical protein
VQAGQLRGGGVLRLGGGDLDRGGHGRMLIETIRYRQQVAESSGGRAGVPPSPRVGSWGEAVCFEWDGGCKVSPSYLKQRTYC